MTSRAAWIWLFAGYFLLQAAVRIFVSPALELDEAEAFWFARDLSLGYNAQPPLYFWLQWVAFQVFGEGIVALAMLKALLLWGAFSALFLMLSRETSPLQAGVAVLALGLLPQVVWEAQRALTHSVLVFAMAVAWVVLFRRVILRGKWGDHLALGLVTGLGVISKYNFVLVPFGLILWVALSREGRRVDWRRFGLSMGLAALIVAPVAIWALTNTDVAGGSVHKLGLDSTGFVAARVQGMISLAIGLLSFFAPALLVLGGLWVFRVRRFALRPDVVRYLAGGVAVGLGILAVGVLLSGATEVKDRWLLPLAWPLVPAAVLWLWPVLGARQRSGLAIGTGALWIVAMLALPYASLRDPGYRAGDFAGLEAAMTAVDPAPDMVVSNVLWVLGNLALRNPDMALAWAGAGAGTGTGTGDSAGLLIVEAGQGLLMAEELGLEAGTPVQHEISRGTRVMAVEIVSVTGP
jgi:4-amino-4-deoxy-L-arabinose transferase-like glycosyltransferase